MLRGPWIGVEVSPMMAEREPAAYTSYLYYDPHLDLQSLADFSTLTAAHPCFDFVREPFRYIDSAYVTRARSLNLSLVSWSETNQVTLRQLGQLGFDFVCTDDTAGAVAALAFQSK